MSRRVNNDLFTEDDLIQNDDNEQSVVRDVVGLSDGQTIHLVPKRKEHDVTTHTSSNEESDNNNKCVGIVIRQCR